MKILILPGYFEPEQMSSSHLNHDRFQAFADSDINMLVCTPMPTRGISQEIRNEYKKRKHEFLYDGKLEVYRFSMYREGRNPILRAFRYFLCIFRQFVFGLTAKDIDLMYISSTPPIQGIMGGLLKKIKGFKYVYILQDIFPDSLVGTGLAKKGGLVWKIGRMIENFTYRNADKIIVISEDFKRNIMAKGVPEEKIVVVYNWVDEKKVVPIEKVNNPLFNELDLDPNKFNIVYAGNLSNAQNVDIILNSAESLINEKNIQFVIFGKGVLEEEIKNKIKNKDLTNVKMLPLQPYERVSLVYSLGDVCVVSCKKGLGGAAMPSKTWSIMSCGRAVLANFDKGELKEIVENNKCGLFTEAGNQTAFNEAILYLYNHPQECEDYGKNARQFILNNLTKEVGTQKYVDVIKSFEKK